MKIKKGDNVVMIAGKDRGKSGEVLSVFPKRDQVIVDGVNITTHHEKSRRRGQQGQIVKKSAPVHVSNVAVKDKKTDKPVRIGYIYEGEGEKRKKVRVVRPSGEKI